MQGGTPTPPPFHRATAVGLSALPLRASRTQPSEASLSSTYVLLLTLLPHYLDFDLRIALVLDACRSPVVTFVLPVTFRLKVSVQFAVLF